MNTPQITPRPWMKDWPAPTLVLQVPTPHSFRTDAGRFVARHVLSLRAGDWVQISPDGRNMFHLGALGVFFNEIEPLTEAHTKGPRPAHTYRANRPQGWRPS